MVEGERILIIKKKPVLNREQKTGFGMVLGFGSLALVFGMFYLWKHVASPFVISYVGPKFLTGDQKEQEKMELLKKEDTDGDLINDYDELYVYRTSPYLKDTDGDGTEDKIEIAQGEDPNCAPNMPCATEIASDSVNPGTLKGTFVEELARQSIAGAGEAPAEPSANTINIAATLEQMSADQIRSMLVQSGGDTEAIAALTDEQLRAALAQALTQLEAERALTANSIEPTVTDTQKESDTSDSQTQTTP